MVHILLLLVEEVSRDRIEAVASQLMFPLDGSEEIELDSPIDRKILVLMCPVGLGGEDGVLHPCPAAPHPTPLVELLINAQGLSSLVEVGEVKVGNVVANDDVRV